jgi:hypothetical protein
MDFYIKDGKTWRTKKRVEAHRWNLCHADELVGSSTIAFYTGDADMVAKVGDVVISGDFLGVVTSVQADGGEVTVTCGTVDELFNRDVAAVTSGGTIGDQLMYLIVSDFVNQPDEHYALPFVSITVKENTPAVSVRDLIGDDDQIYNVRDVIKAAWMQYRVLMTAKAKSDGLELTIRSADDTHHNIVMDDGRHQLVSRTYGDHIVEKVTVLAYNRDDVLIGTADYYYHASGEILQTPAEKRMPGAWKTVSVSYSEDREDQPPLADVMLSAAKKEMADNIKDHTVEIKTDKLYNFGDRVSVRFSSGEVLDTRVTAIYTEKGDSRKHYRLGTLPVTLSQKIMRGVLK